MSHEVSGKIHQIGETQTFTSGFQKRLCVVEFKDGDYTNYLAVDFIKDKCALLDQHAEGQEVTINYNIRSNENPHKPGQWFTNPTAWKIDGGQHQQAGHPMPNGSGLGQSVENESDQIPF